MNKIYISAKDKNVLIVFNTIESSDEVTCLFVESDRYSRRQLIDLLSQGVLTSVIWSGSSVTLSVRTDSIASIWMDEE